MNEEPVAYAWCKNGKMLSAMIGKYEPIKTDPYWLENGFDAIPLYTHPAKTLTYEEIDTIKEALLMIGFQDAFINYHLKEEALAILKKASEK